MHHLIYLVDVFSKTAYAGNPLAVVIGESFLSQERMQQIAAEMNFSETTFVLKQPEADGGYRMRIFTPSREIEFTGHPLLGTAWVIRRYLLSDAEDTIQLNTPVGVVPVTFSIDDEQHTMAWFDAPQMSLGNTANAKQMAQALGLSVDDLDQSLPIQQVSTGTSAMMVPVKTLEALKHAKLNLGVYTSLLQQDFPPLTYLFTTETHDAESDYCVRFFFDAHGVREDPATGNGAAFFGAYLLHNTDKQSYELRIEQGHEVRRPSSIYIKASKVDERYQVRVGGYVVPTIEGRLLE